MNPLILLGNPETKRTLYFQKAAADTKVFCHLWEWGSRFPMGQWEKLVLKVDPPLWDTCSLEELDDVMGRYQKRLEAVAALEKNLDIRFLNHPKAIMALLDKRQCKEQLIQAGLPVTKALKKKAHNAQQLMEQMEAEGIFQVFIKPVCGSGAAGTAAFRFQPGNGKMTLYTCAMTEPSQGRLVNTKRLRRFSKKEEILPLLERILKLDCLAERWYAKAVYQGYSYDLRAVMQDGRLDFLLARLAKGPITNLHLNNQPLLAEELNLSLGIREQIEDLCLRAVSCYPALRSAGIDILLERGNQKPRIIEMNGQGDLIYQDIYQGNRIYRHQVEMMRDAYV